MLRTGALEPGLDRGEAGKGGTREGKGDRRARKEEEIWGRGKLRKGVHKSRVCVWETGVRGGSSTSGLSIVSPCLPPKAAFTKRFTRQVLGVLCSPAL